MISFEQARQIVAAQQIAPPPAGTYWVAPWGYEDADVYALFTGAREWMVDHNDQFAPPLDGGTAVFVNKTSGTPELVSYVANRQRIKAMKPAGARHV